MSLNPKDTHSFSVILRTDYIRCFGQKVHIVIKREIIAPKLGKQKAKVLIV